VFRVKPFAVLLYAAPAYPYICREISKLHGPDISMRAETEKTIGQIKQSLELLRRHL